MGSSCFSRGNAVNVEIIETFLKRYGLEASVGVEGGTELRGTLCEERCKEGPIVVIDGVVHRRVTPAILPDLLAGLLAKAG
jgi:NADH:ubiquinone oxidoreductase subunit E